VSGKATAEAPSNIAFIKYWGATDLDRAEPCNPSISMTLRECVSRCTAEYREDDDAFEVSLRTGDGLAPAPDGFASGVARHLGRILEHFGRAGSFRIAASNSFPMAAGIASSASGFTALALAASSALGETLDGPELSSLARSSGSGSAARSAFGGFVEWPAVGGHGEAICLAGAEHWELCDVVAITDSRPKLVSSRDGHRRAQTSPHFETRQKLLPQRLELTREAIMARELTHMGPVIEEEAIELHLIAMSSVPPIFYWNPGTLAVLQEVRELREHGASVWATMDAGANVHLICPPEDKTEVAERVGGLSAVESVIVDGVGGGPHLDAEPLF